MKALISSTEPLIVGYISSWEQDGDSWNPVYTYIEGCLRVAQVEQDENIFEVHGSLYWVDCPDDCEATTWYYKDGEVLRVPDDVEDPNPEQ